MSRKKRTQNTNVVLIVGVVLIAIGLFFFLTLLGFDPNDSLYFSNQPAQKVTHFLGRTGVSASGFLFYFLGRSSFILTLALIVSGVVLLQKLSPMRTIGYLVLSFFLVIFSLGIFSRPVDMPLYKGGGLFGKILILRLSSNVRKDIVFIIFLTLFSVSLILLFKNPLQRIFSGGRRNAVHSKQKKKSASNRKKAEFRVFDDEAQESIVAVKKRGKKLPLIRKVYMNEEEQAALRREREKQEESPPFEQGTGQYLLSENDAGIEQRRREIKVELNASMLKKSKYLNIREREKETTRKARELERTLNEFGIDAKVTGIIRGPVITRYELQPAPGVKLSRIVNLSDNIALSLSANGVRIEAPIPGRAAVGIEIPNDEREIVTLGDILEEAKTYGQLPLILGRDISGKVVVSDLTDMPHLLIAGATGSGKSVCVNSLIVSMLFKKRPDEVRFLLIDPKMVELKIYNGIPHLLTEVVTDPRNASKALRWVIHEMENRYRLLDEHYVRDITGYNRKVREKMHFIIIIIDEFANLMAASQKEVEDAVVRIAAMSRAVGIHLIMATQRPSVDVITGLIKANFPFRIAFQVASKTDSRTILDTIGAEKLLGRGDMLFSPAGSLNIRRIQGAYISEEEVSEVVEDLRKSSTPEYRDDIFDFGSPEAFALDENDPVFDDAVEIVLKTKRASASFLQRRLKIGYNRAARLIELMEERGIIGPPRGSKPREIFVDRID
jgi:S-DNA-T family DNA segregation ATPase FtsK/SpoIIIE